jgi:hypothetical protein
MTGMTDDELVRVLADAVPAMPAPPDRMDRVAARVRRHHARLATGTAVAVVVAVLAVVALPRTWASPRPEAVPPAASTPAGDDPICGPAPYLTPAPSPFGGAWPPRLDGTVRVTLCEWRREDSGYALQRRLIVTDGVRDVVSTLLAAPPDEVRQEDFPCAVGTGRLSRLAFDLAGGSREWVGLTCDVLWQSSWQRYGGRAVLDAITRLSSPPAPTFPPAPT